MNKLIKLSAPFRTLGLMCALLVSTNNVFGMLPSYTDPATGQLLTADTFVRFKDWIYSEWLNDQAGIASGNFMDHFKNYGKNNGTQYDPIFIVLGQCEGSALTFDGNDYIINGHWYKTLGWANGRYCGVFVGTDGYYYMNAGADWYYYEPADNSWYGAGENPPI